MGKKLPSYARADRQRITCADFSALEISELWDLHDKVPISRLSHTSVSPSRLDLKIELTERLMKSCVLCERRCGVDRTSGETGFCGVGVDSCYFFEQVLWGEEAPLVPSHEIFFSGCNLRCKFCYSWESLGNTKHGKLAVTDDLASLIGQRRAEGAVNVNLIGGEPTVHLPNILKTLKKVTHPTPVVWNSNFLMSEETMKLLDGVVDLYVGDFRFGNNECADVIGGIRSYFDTAARNFRTAARSGDLIIRHLLLPGHVDCCLRPIAEWVAQNLPDVPFNLMFQYTPFYEALTEPKLCRQLEQAEISKATEIVTELGLNTKRWNRPLSKSAKGQAKGSGELNTTIIIRPDGRVEIMHLHKEMVELAQVLECGGKSDE